MKLPKSAHAAHPWRIHEIAPEFHLEDVWALPTPGGPDDFPKLVDLMITFDPGRDGSAPVRALFALRWKIGEIFGWDKDSAGLGSRVSPLRERLPADLRETPLELDNELPFKGLYLTDDEWALEIANDTVHGVLHVGWIADDSAEGGYRGQMAVLVKPNGLFGRAYMAAIMPFRYAIVYPEMLRAIGRKWASVQSSSASGVR